MNKQYYYLVASLPVLRLDDNKMPYRPSDFVGGLAGELDEEELSFMRDIASFYDHALFINVATGTADAARKSRGAWSVEEAKQAFEEKEFPFQSYLNDFIVTYTEKKRDTAPERSELENMLLDAFYRRMLSRDNRFIREYFSFDLTLRNILVSLNAKRFGIETPGHIALDALTDIDNDQAGGVTKDAFRNVPYLGELVDNFENKDILHCERFIDQLRWERIDEINLLSYFDIDILLGHLIQLLLVERWLMLDPKHGREIFNERTQATLS